MIISHRHKYLFIEIPLTGSWSIHNELCEHYSGQPILHKHAIYAEFRRKATKEELTYFKFATVRNPLDAAVSQYFKLRTDHKGIYSDVRSADELTTDYSDKSKYDYIAGDDVTFAEYLLRFHRRIYSGHIDVSADALDFVIRYETLQDDFKTVLAYLNLEQVRPLPTSNKTQGRRRSWESYYDERVIRHAKRIFGPSMETWNYTFPSHWGDHQPNLTDQLTFRLLNRLRRIYLNHFRYSQATHARAIRRLRAELIH